MKEGSGISLSLNLKKLFPFELDEFQLKAIAALDKGKSVVVCAPTGSGKTLIGEYAIHRALWKGKRVFYTTPLKALSNQKFRDFQAQFAPNHSVGLITGDIIINPQAPVVIMTTEIFRNMLYETPIGEVGTSLENVESVILDECHYISDPYRGTVWEESIIYCPSTIQLVALSATIGNPEELTDWINQVRSGGQKASEQENCELINSDFRPVPLRFYFSKIDGLFPLLNQKQKKINPNLKEKIQKGRQKRLKKEDCPNISQVVRQLEQKDMLPAIYIIFSRKGCEQAVQQLNPLNLVSPQESQQIYLILLYFFLKGQPELQMKLLNSLANYPDLQQHLFSFLGDNPHSDTELWEFLAQNPYLKTRLIECLAETSKIGKPSQLEALIRGIASHHAGLLPAWKELVEKLFELGLIKVVFATATLAAGINMPARTTVISALSKRTENGHSMLTPSEFLQIAGRAGRRGKDKIGHVVTIQTPFEGAKEAAYLATATPENLVSCFTPSYGMVLNLLQKHSLEEIKNLLELSLAEYLAKLKLEPKEQEINELHLSLAKLDIEFAELERNGIGAEAIASYQKIKERLKEEDRLLEILQQQAQNHRKKEIAPQLMELEPGNILALKGKHIPLASPLTAVVVTKIPGSGQAPNLVCLGADNYWYLVTNADVVDLNQGFLSPQAMTNLSWPDLETIKLGRCGKGDAVTEIVINQMLKAVVPVLPPPEISQQQHRVDAVQAMLDNHPLQQRKNPTQIIKHYQERLLKREQLRKNHKNYQQQKSNSSYYWREFLNLIEILQEFQALDGLQLTTLGEAAAIIRGENELWLALALMSGELDRLEPPQLAGAVSALISEPPRPDSWADCLPSPVVLQAFGFDKSLETLYPTIDLRETRRKLNQIQKRYDITIPVLLEVKMIGLVEQWALGVEWHELCELTSLDEGDLVRMLRRTIDILWQIPQIPRISSSLKQNAEEAISSLKRFPI